MNKQEANKKAKEIFTQWQEKRRQIEAELGFALDWRELPDKKASRIIIEKPVNLDNHDEWNHQFDWIVDVCIKFKKVFKKYL